MDPHIGERTMSPVDDITLSRYLDGELDYDRAKAITDRIHGEPAMHDKLVGMTTTQALLKSFSRMKSQEDIPVRLIRTLHQKKQKKIFSLGENRALQAAAVFLLFIGSFFLGRNNSTSHGVQASLFPVIPVALEQTINEVLEYQKSGLPQNWVELDNGVSARITPVRSFRGGKGEFYRLFVIDMDKAGSGQHFWGMARRSGKESWQTKGIFTNGTPGSI